MGRSSQYRLENAIRPSSGCVWCPVLLRHKQHGSEWLTFPPTALMVVSRLSFKAATFPHSYPLSLRNVILTLRIYSTLRHDSNTYFVLCGHHKNLFLLAHEKTDRFPVHPRSPANLVFVYNAWVMSWLVPHNTTTRRWM
jgi:hypothetical protein